MPDFSGSINSLVSFQAAAQGVGGLFGFVDQDGIMRQVPMFFSVGGKILPSLSIETTRFYGERGSATVAKSLKAALVAQYRQARASPPLASADDVIRPVRNGEIPFGESLPTSFG